MTPTTEALADVRAYMQGAPLTVYSAMTADRIWWDIRAGQRDAVQGEIDRIQDDPLVAVSTFDVPQRCWPEGGEKMYRARGFTVLAGAVQ